MICTTTTFYRLLYKNVICTSYFFNQFYIDSERFKWELDCCLNFASSALVVTLDAVFIIAASCTFAQPGVGGKLCLYMKFITKEFQSDFVTAKSTWWLNEIVLL